MKNNGLKDDELQVAESGAARHRPLLHARSRRALLERELRKICRKVVKELLLQEATTTQDVIVTREEPRQVPRRAPLRLTAWPRRENQVGQVTGLAWTEVGGDLLTIEAAVMPGKGKMITHRQARRRDEGIDRRPRCRWCAAARSSSASSRGLLRRRTTCTSTCPKARRRRTARARASAIVHGARLGADRHSGARATSR